MYNLGDDKNNFPATILAISYAYNLVDDKNNFPATMLTISYL